MIVLSDLDGVGAEWDGGFDRHALSEAYAHVKGIPLRHERKSFRFYDEVSEEVRAAITEIMNHPTFYADLDPIEGWVEAMRKMDESGIDVRIVTTPWWDNHDCMRDKANWVAKHLGEDWRKRIVLTGDKTIVAGDVLIDDKPDIQGLASPVWQQVLFDQPYNRDSDLPRIHNWTDGSWMDLVSEAAVRSWTVR